MTKVSDLDKQIKELIEELAKNVSDEEFEYMMKFSPMFAKLLSDMLDEAPNEKTYMKMVASKLLLLWSIILKCEPVAKATFDAIIGMLAEEDMVEVKVVDRRTMGEVMDSSMRTKEDKVH